MSSSRDHAQSTGVKPRPTPSEILTKAAELLEQPGTWTQGWWARDARGDLVNPRDRTAICFCVRGAIERVGGRTAMASELVSGAEQFLRRKLGIKNRLAGWNDAVGRTQAEVVAALRAAADLARTEQVKG